MPAILRRLRHSFRQRGHRYTTTDPAPTPSQIALEKQKVEDQRENDADDEHARRPSSTHSSLPVLCDRGPYGPGIYPKEELYWNSIMYASDVEPQMVGPVYGRVKQEIRRSPVKRNVKRWCDPPDNLKPSVMHAQVNTHAPQSPKPQEQPLPPSPPRDPITPGTREWDTFMDFPFEQVLPMYRDCEGNSQRYPPGTAITTDVPTLAPSPLSNQVHSSTQAQSGTQALPVRTRELARSPQSPAQTSSSVGQTDVQNRETLTWNAVLNQILNNEAVDPALKAAVRKRVQRSSTTNGSGHGDTFFVAAKEAGLVPNFSYPMASSAFYDREEAHPSAERSLQQEQLQNGISPTHDNNSSDSLYRAPTPPNWPIPEGYQEEGRNASHSGTSHRASSSTPSLDPRQRSSSPPDPTPDRVYLLLYSLLTPSEVSLYHRVVDGERPAPCPPFPEIAPPSNATSSTPLAARLIQNLHTVVFGLQDRITGLEDDPIPQLSAHLEEKGSKVDDLGLEITLLEKEILHLKRAVDFGSRVLAGCWEREWESWRTVLEIRKQREMGRGVLSRLMLRGRSTVERDQRRLDGSMPEGYVARGSAPESAHQKLLLDRELNALVLMAEQNVRIIREGMVEMLGLVRDCQRSAERAGNFGMVGHEI